EFDNVLVVLSLLFDQLQKLFRLLVLQLFQIELIVRVFLDQLLEFLHSRGRNLLFFGQTNFFRRSNFIGKAHRLGAQDFILGKDRDDVLLAAHHKGGYAGQLFFFHGLRQKFVSLLGSRAGRKKVRTIEIKRWNVFERNEAAQINVAALFRSETFEFFIRDNDKTILLDFVSANHLVIVEVSSGFL